MKPAHTFFVCTSFAALAIAAPAVAQDAQLPAATSSADAGEQLPAATNSVDNDAIIVTARRREETLQTVPVAIQAFSSEQLEERGIQELGDLSSSVAGLRFGSEGGKNGTTLTLRGLSRIPLGEGVPAVVTYFANVPLAGEGSNLPTFDLSGIQVLKGPQGTLFGQNTIGGAVLVEPARPSFDLGGYVQGQYGNFDALTIEGAINVPVIADVAAIRVAGQMRRRDGYVTNLSGGENFDDIHQDSARISLLVEPSSNFSNTTIFDWVRS